MQHLRILTTAGMLLLATAVAGSAQQARNTHPTRTGQTSRRHETQADLARKARIPEVDARRTALAAVPHSRVKSGELEREHGHLIYSYDLTVPGRSGIEEVAVDAISGKILSREHEGPKQERAEARAEAGKKH